MARHCLRVRRRWGRRPTIAVGAPGIELLLLLLFLVEVVSSRDLRQLRPLPLFLVCLLLYRLLETTDLILEVPHPLSQACILPLSFFLLSLSLSLSLSFYLLAAGWSPKGGARMLLKLSSDRPNLTGLPQPSHVGSFQVPWGGRNTVHLLHLAYQFRTEVSSYPADHALSIFCHQ